MIAMLIALVGYSRVPDGAAAADAAVGLHRRDPAVHRRDASSTAPAGVLLNAYAAVPSMHVCFALMIGLPMSRLVHSRVARVLWRMYPAFIAFVVIVDRQPLLHRRLPRGAHRAASRRCWPSSCWRERAPTSGRSPGATGSRRGRRVGVASGASARHDRSSSTSHRLLERDRQMTTLCADPADGSTQHTPTGRGGEATR